MTHRLSLPSVYDAHEDRDQDKNIPLLNRPSSQRLSTQIRADRKCKNISFKFLILIIHVDSSTETLS
jgi:hypothetical protein